MSEEFATWALTQCLLGEFRELYYELREKYDKIQTTEKIGEKTPK